MPEEQEARPELVMEGMGGGGGSASGGSKAVIAVVVVLLVAAGVAVYARQVGWLGEETSQEEQGESTEHSDVMGTEGEGMMNGDVETGTMIDDGMGFNVDAPEGQSKTFDVAGKNFEFSLKEIRVKKGDTVTINFSSTAGTHDWVVDEFSAKTEIVNAGGSSIVVFTADQSGEFEYYCGIGSHRSLGMVGTLIVEE